MGQIQIVFPKLSQFWNDAGVLGLYRCILGKVHADPQEEETDPMDDLGERLNVSVRLAVGELVLEGEEPAMQELLEIAYGRLIKRYYDISTQRQKDDLAAHNFYYDSQTDTFVRFSKRKARGIAAFIYDKAPRPAGDLVKWQNKIAGVLPASQAHLQGRLDDFLEQQEIKAGPPSGMLIDEPNRVRPRVSIYVKEGKPKKEACFLCGGMSSKMERVNQTVFPFLTGDAGVLSFFSTTRNVSQACWRCAFVGKFVPVSGFFLQSRDRCHMFFPLATSLTKMNEVYDSLRRIANWEPNYWCNFEHALGGYFSHPSEAAFAFFFRVYEYLAKRKDADEDDVEWLLDDEIQDEIINLALQEAPLSFAIISTEQKGQIQMPTRVWIFDELTYLFRLFREVQKRKLDWRDVCRNMLDSTAARDENRSLVRDHMLGCIMQKRSILQEAVDFVFHVNRGQRQYIAPLVEFVRRYEEVIKQGGTMEREALDAAVTLGRRIGTAVGKESGKKGRLFALRKCRKLSDFLNELNRLQLRLSNEYQFAVPPAVYEGHLTQENFEEFRGFCMLAALNAFNAATSQREQATASTNN